MIRLCPFIPLSVSRVVSWFQALLIMKSEVNPKSFIFHIIEWHLVKKKISNRIDVERPEEDILLRYRENSHEPLPNYAEDHILNTVSN